MAERETGVAEAKRLLADNGYVVLKAKSYRQAQERQRVAEAMRDYADEVKEDYRRWAEQECAEERRLRERLTFVYGVARAHGASEEELRQPQGALRDTAGDGRG